jgi:integrase
MAVTRHGFVRATVKVNGRQYEHHFPKGTSQRTIADWKARERIRRLDDQPTAVKGTLARDVDTYLSTLTHRKPLWKERTRHLKFWTDRFGSRKRSELQPGELAAALSELRATKAASTCNHVRIALSHLFTALDGKNAPNPLRDVPSFEEPEPEPRALPYYLIDRVLACMTRKGYAPKGQKRPSIAKTRLRLRVMADTGLTPAQQARLRPEDLRLDIGAVYVRRRLKGKGSPGSLKPLSQAGVEALRAWAVGNAFGPWSPQSARKSWRRACDKAMALPETTEAEAAILLSARAYDLRHSFGTLVFQVTGNLHTTGELLDHRSAKTTRRYALAAIPAHLRAAVDSLKGWHSQPPTPEPTDKKGL